MTSAQPGVAVVGGGYWGRNLVRTFAELDALVAVVDANPRTARELADRHDVKVADLAEVLVDGDIDAMVIAAPAADHADLAVAALEAGKHVYVEKPLALTLDDARRVVETASAHSRTLMVGHLLQYHPAFVELASMVGAGRLGTLRYLYSNRLNLGRFRQEENILWSFAPHDLSMILALVGESPDHVEAVGSTFLTDNIPDVTTTHLTFRSGPRAHVFVSWLHPFKEQRLVVVGASAMAVFDDRMPWESKLTLYEHSVDWRDGVPIPVPGDGTAVALEEAEPLRLECEHFLDCVRTGRRPRTDGEEGMAVLEVLDAAQRSLVRNGAVDAMPAKVGPSPRVAPAAIDPAAVLHPTAVVDSGATIGPRTRVWHFSHVLSDTTIGSDCTLGQNVVVGPGVTVGDRCRVQNNVSVYSGVHLEDGVFCGPSCVFTNVYNPRAEVSRKDEFMTTVVRRGATIGANATIVCGNEIGEYAFIGAGAVVIDDVPAYALMVGNPARRVGWMSASGERLGDDLVCPRTGDRYVERDGRLWPVSSAAEPD
ncbi:MAG: Gfo/Idh/MocA family oxidoreductase [Microthrixaceae bacterium]